VWQGGEWHIRDITNTMTTVAFFLLKHAAQNREHWLQRFYEIEKEAVRPRRDGELWGFKINVGTNTKPLLDALERGGIEIGWPQGDKPVAVSIDSHLGGTAGFPGRTAIVPMSQPYAGFAKALLERQRYPDLRDSSGRPIPPYDVTGHTLSLLMNVDAQPISAPFNGAFLKRVHLRVGIPDCLLTGKKDIGLYKSSVPVIDEGWTRWAFGGCTEYNSLNDSQIRNGNLRSTFRTIIIPDQPRAAILNGYRAGAMPPEYTGGLGAEGVKGLREFVEQGGTLVCLNRASDFVIEQFKLPIRDVVDGLPRTDFYVPGSILRIELDTSDPMTKGMPKESIAWAENSPVFEVIDAARGSSPTVREGSPTM